MDRPSTLQACEHALLRFEKIWFKDTDESHFWQKANQVDSYLRFAALATKVFGNPSYWYRLVTASPNILDDFWTFVVNAQTNPNWWSDDFGWGGIASLTVAEYVLINQPSSKHTWQDWRNIGMACFGRMAKVWDRTLDGLPVWHGIANISLNGDARNSSKNTVTNANFMALSMHLYHFLKKYPDVTHHDAPKESIKYAYKQYLWFLGWFNTKSNGDWIPYDYYHTLIGTPSSAMIETMPVTTKAPGTYPVTQPYIWAAYSSWSGDQGLFLNACALLLLYVNDLGPILGLPVGEVSIVKNNLTVWLKSIADGVYQALASPNVDNVLREAPFSNFFSSDGDRPDYMCGRGVLARFINEEETRDAFNSINQPLTPFNNSFGATAYYIYRTEDPSTYQLKAGWNADRDKAAYEIFLKLWGHGDIDSTWTDEPSAVWQNYCMMMGFDVFGAWLRVSPWWPSSILEERTARPRATVESKL